MSIDHFIYVDGRKLYHRVILLDIIEDINRKGGKDYGDNSVYLMQRGVEYLYQYVDPDHARADFEEWRGQPLETITLKLDGVVQPGDRLPLTKEEIRAFFANPDNFAEVDEPEDEDDDEPLTEEEIGRFYGDDEL